MRENTYLNQIEMSTAFTLYKNYVPFQTVWQIQISGFVPYTLHLCHFGGKLGEKTKMPRCVWPVTRQLYSCFWCHLVGA